jgi:Zn-dependent peptidase ImmA (M78 family)/transcriptional regulator with XRE-family HTH domain
MGSHHIRLARDFHELSQADLAGRSGMAQARIARLELGDVNAEPVEVELLSSHLGFPVSFFTSRCLHMGATGEVHFRRKRATLACERRKAVALANLAVHAAHELDELLGIPDSPTPMEAGRMRDFGGSAAAAAHSLRKAWRVAPGPIRNLTELVEEAGVAVFQVELIDDLDGLSLWTADRTPVVVLNRAMPGERQRWTLAHEIGHLVLHTIHRDAGTMEEEANAFAAELLAPEADVKSSLRSLTLASLRKLKPEWGMSMQALIYRAGELGMLTPYQIKGWFTMFSKRGWRKSEPDPLAPECTVKIHAEISRATALFGSRTVVADFLNLPIDILNRLAAPDQPKTPRRLRLLSREADDSCTARE